jgi:streptogramin lyase
VNRAALERLFDVARPILARGSAMRRIHPLLILMAFAILGTVSAQTPESGKDELATLKELGLGTDGKALLDYLRKQTYPEADPKQMDALILQLGDDEFKVRESAYGKLIGLGKAALVGLKIAEKDRDFEIRRRAEDLRSKLEAKVEPAIQVASARRIALLKPEGSAEVLLSFLPFAADLTVTDEVCKALGAVAVMDNGVDPVVVKALEDKHPLKRGAAGEALAHARATELLPEVRMLLKDPDPLVRVRAGVALVNTRDPSAISEALPAVIECLKHLPPENLWRAEDLLIKLAGEGKVPAASLGTSDTGKEACFTAWENWYQKNQKEINLAKLDQAEPIVGNTLIVYQNANRAVGVALGAAAIRRTISGEIVEVDKNKKVLWKITVEEGYPVDAMVLPDRTGEVVVAEYQRGRVTIRETKTNKIVWDHAVGGNPIGVQALPEGKIVVTMQNRIVEIDRATKQQKTLVNQANGSIFRSKMTKGGDLVYVTNFGQLTRVNAKGTQVKQFQVPEMTLFGNIDLLPNGNVVVPDVQGSRVVEYDTNGNQVAQIQVPAFPPNTATRVAGGNTLVSSMNTQRVTEYNRAGQAVWTYDVQGQIINARRR